MTSVAARRALIDSIKSIPARERSWLAGDDPAVWAYNGLGIMLNSAQETEINAVLDWPPGTIHVWRFANRTGKTAGLMVLHMLAVWRKWRYPFPNDNDFWLAYKYRTLHAAPLNRLMGRAWEMGEAITKGSSDLQRNPRTYAQNRAPLAPLFTAGKGLNPDGSDALFIKCANGGIVDFLSTSEGAARMESEKWWLLGWDEFVRQEPVSDIPILFDQTFLPRSSDFMAPVILSGTETDDAAPIYAELEEEAASNPRDWNFVSHARAENFAIPPEANDRQMRVSLDKSIARRSVMGESGEGGRGTLYPTFLLNNAFREGVSPYPRTGATILSSFDHALKGDLSVIRSVEVPWPLPSNRDDLIGKIRGLGGPERKSSATLTVSQLVSMVMEEHERLRPRWIIVDATGEGGVAVFRELRAKGLPVIDCSFSKKLPGVGVTNKEFGLQWLQHMLDWGLEPKVRAEDGWVNEWENPKGEYGLLRLPAELRKDRRELAVLRKDDHNIAQDRAMTYVQIAWFLAQHLARAAAPTPQPFSIIPKRPRTRLATAGRMRASMVRR